MNNEKLFKEYMTLFGELYDKPISDTLKNAYWKAYSIRALINGCDKSTQKGFLERIEKLKRVYAQMSEIYQKNKGDTNIPLK